MKRNTTVTGWRGHLCNRVDSNQGRRDTHSISNHKENIGARQPLSYAIDNRCRAIEESCESQINEDKHQKVTVLKQQRQPAQL